MTEATVPNVCAACGKPFDDHHWVVPSKRAKCPVPA